MCVCGSSKEDMFVCLHAYTFCMCMFFFCFHVSMWRMMVPGLDGGILAPAGLLKPASAQDQGAQGAAAAAPSQPDCTPAAIPSASATSLAGCSPALFPPIPPSWQTGGFL